MAIDFAKTTRDYAAYRPPFAPALFDRLRRFGIGTPGQLVLDLASGTGLFAYALEERGCSVIRADQSLDMLRAGRPNRSLVAHAESLPLADDAVNVVTAANCWHWFDRDVAPKEILRVLQPDGWLVIAYQMYVPLAGSIAEMTEQLIMQHQPRWRHANSAGINGQVLRDVQRAGFDEIESFTFDASIDFTKEQWRGFIRSTSPIGPSMTPVELKRFDTDHAALLETYPAILPIPHRLFAAVCRKPIIGSDE